MRWERRRPARFDDRQQLHLRAAMRAARDGRIGNDRFRLVEFAAHQRADQQALSARRGAGPPMVTHAHEALGQDMGEPTLEKSLHRQGDDVRAVRAAFVAEQADAPALVVAEQALRAERGAEDISGEITQRGPAAPGVAHIGHPLRAEDLRVLLRQPGVEFRMIGPEGEFQTVAEPRGQGRAVEQEAGLRRKTQQLLARVERHAGDDDMHVGMVLHPASPGVQHGGEAGLAAELGAAQVFQRPGGLAQQQPVKDCGFEFAEAPQLVGHRESDQEIRHAGQQPRLPDGGPFSLVERAAPRTGTMVATMIGVVRVATGAGALPDVAAEHRGAAGHDGPRRPVMGGGEPRAVAAGEARPVGAQNLVEGQRHGASGLRVPGTSR